MDQDEAEKTCSNISREIWNNYKIVRKYKNYFTNGQVELDAIELHGKYKLDRIISFRELEMLRAARFRDHLGLEGQCYASAVAFRDKIEMKDLALRGGLKTPAFAPIRMATDLYQFIDIHQIVRQFDRDKSKSLPGESGRFGKTRWPIGEEVIEGVSFGQPAVRIG